MFFPPNSGEIWRNHGETTDTMLSNQQKEYPSNLNIMGVECQWPDHGGFREGNHPNRQIQTRLVNCDDH